jgi:isoleucyl-tRNA synthetase
LDCPSSWKRSELAADFEISRQIQSLAHNVLEKARIDRSIGSSLEADLIIATPQGRVYEALKVLICSLVSCHNGKGFFLLF